MQRYLDNPISHRDYIRSLTNKELDAYVKGYLMACIHVREAFTDCRTQLLKARLQYPAGSYKARLLESHVELLDNFEVMIAQKEGNLSLKFPENICP